MLFLLKVFWNVLIVVMGFFFLKELLKLKINKKINLFLGNFNFFNFIEGCGKLILIGMVIIGIGEIVEIVFVV